MIIGLVGYKGSGKTVAANFLAETYNMKRVNFKDALIQEIKDNFPDLLKAIRYMLEAYDAEFSSDCHWTIEDLFNHKPPLVRALMQNYGTEVRRRDDPKYWVEQWTESVWKARGERSSSIVTDDVRFHNEASAIKYLDGIIIRIERTDIDNGGNHQSETEQNEIVADYTIIVGQGEIDKLTAELKRIVDSL